MRVRIVTDKSPEALALTRHSTAHLMAAAVTALFPGAQCGIGPAIDEGYFYDFVVPQPFVPEDLERIEAKMRELAAQDLVYERQMWDRDEALAFFAQRGEPLKVQLIEEKTAGQARSRSTPSRTATPSWTSASARTCPARRGSRRSSCMSTSNAYWKGDAKNQPMQRLYGTAFLSQKDLDAHLTRIEEAKKRDHRKVGKELGPVHVPPVGAGRHVLAGQGRHALQHARRLHAQRALPRRLRRGEDADRLQQGPVGNLGPLVALPREHVPRASRRTARRWASRP